MSLFCFSLCVPFRWRAAYSLFTFFENFHELRKPPQSSYGLEGVIAGLSLLLSYACPNPAPSPTPRSFEACGHPCLCCVLLGLRHNMGSASLFRPFTTYSSFACVLARKSRFAEFTQTPKHSRHPRRYAVENLNGESTKWRRAVLFESW